MKAALLSASEPIQVMSLGSEKRNHLPDGAERQKADRKLASGEPLRTSAWLYGDDEDAIWAGATRVLSCDLSPMCPVRTEEKWCR